MKPAVTLKQIQMLWDLPALTSMNHEQLCLALLSDDFNGTLANQGSTIQNLGRSTLGKFVNGNLRSKGSRAFANMDTTKKMLHHIRTNSQIPYRANLELPPRTCRESMLNNIRVWVDRTIPAMTGDHPLFTQLALIDEAQLNEGEKAQFRALQQTIDALRADGTPEALTYAIFLLALTAIFRHQMAVIPELYDLDAIRESFHSSPAPAASLGEEQTLFTDPDYMNEYWLYLMRTGHNRLYERAHLRLSLDPEGAPRAEMKFFDSNNSHVPNHAPVDRQFTGTPYRSSRDKSVYIVMQDQNQYLGLLIFEHQHFNYGPMYFRSALFLSTHSQTHHPMVQRVAISARKLENEELPYAEGFLRTAGTDIILTDQQLQTFRKKFQGYPWMEEFETSILPFITSHTCKCYRFDESELLSYSMTGLDEQERLKIMLALKSLTEPNRTEKHLCVTSQPPSGLHELFR